MREIVTETAPFIWRDMRQGRITPTAIADYLVPQNSVQSCFNVNFDTIVGAGVVRPGTTTTGTVASGKTPLGLTEFVGKNGSPNYMISVFKGASNATAYYYNGTTWAATNETALSNTAKDRFATLGGSVFMTNNVNGMFSSPSGTTFSTTNAIPSTASLPSLAVKPSLVYRYAARLLCSGDTNNPSRVYFSSIVDPGLSAEDIAVTSVTSASTTATVTTTSAHGLVTGATVRISGATQTEYNGFYVITVTGASTFTYTFAGSVTTPATGTITASATFITWNTNASTGDWIDINPDDGGQVTAFSETSSFLLVFKSNGMYRLDTVNKSTDTQNIFNIGAVSQEGVVACQGIVYFFSGTDIRQTDGGFPQQISRAGVQDIINAIPQANWGDVAAGQDGLNVYFFVGDVTLNANTDDSYTITNCALKFSPRDQTWSVHSYASKYIFLCLYTDSTNGRQMRGADTGGLVQTINIGTTDNTTPITYSLETQALEFGNRGHLKSIADKITAFTQNGSASTLQLTADGELQKTQINLSTPVAFSNPSTFTGYYFTVRWYGVSSGTAPVFQGFTFESVQDLGNTNK